MHLGPRGVPETHTVDRDARTLAGRHDRHGGGGKETRRVDAGVHLRLQVHLWDVCGVEQ